MQSYWEDITPAKAAHLLSREKCGRSFSPSLAAMYAKDMLAERWRPSPQGPSVDEDGYLRDGQHRMAGIVKAAVTVRLWMTYDVPSEAFPVMDIGRNRTMSDRLSIEGFKDTTQLAAIARRLTQWEQGSRWSRAMVTREEIAATIEKYPDLTKAATFAHAWKPEAKGVPPAPAIAAFCWYLYQRADSDEAEVFMTSLSTGENLSHGSPVLTLRKRLLAEAERARAQRSTLRQETVIWLMNRAWRGHRERETLTKLQLPNPMKDSAFEDPA